MEACLADPKVVLLMLGLHLKFCMVFSYTFLIIEIILLRVFKTYQLVP